MSLKFKSFAALALSAAMMFSVAACGTTDSGDAKSDSKAKNTTVGYDVSTIKKDDELAKLAASAKTVKDGELSVGMELSYAPAEFYAEERICRVRTWREPVPPALRSPPSARSLPLPSTPTSLPRQ